MFRLVSVRLRSLLVSCVLFLGTIALFSRAWDYDFTNYDDPRYITNNAHVQQGLSWAGLRWAFAGNADYFHPLTWISHELDWQLYGGDATGHRLTSILWHAVNAVLVFFVMRRLTGAFWLSAFSAALFAWHPLRVESVIWVTERKDVMSGCFFLLMIWSHLEYGERRATGQRSARRFYVLTLAAFAGGVMSKPVMVAAPLVLVLLDFWPLRRVALPAEWQPRPTSDASRMAAPPRVEQAWPRLLGEKLPFFALSFAIAIATVLMQHDARAFTLSLPLGARLGNAFVSVARYLGKFFWPFNLTVAYPHPGQWPLVLVIAAAALMVALTGVAVWQWRRRPWVLIGWLWFLIMLAPAIGVVQVGFQAMADRYTYLPILGLQLALLPWLREVAWSRLPGRWAAAAGALVLAGCIARTWNQEATWRDPDTLYAHALEVTTNNWVAHAFLSLNLVAQDRLDEAEQHALQALELNPGYGTAHYALGAVRFKQHRFPEAIAQMQRALEIAPHDALTEFELALLLLQENQTDAAAAHFAHATQNDESIPVALAQLAHTEAMNGNPDGAIALYRQLLRLKRDDATAHHNLAVVLASSGRIAAASEHFAAAIQAAPAVAETQIDFASMLLRSDRAGEALEHFRRASELEPGNAMALLGLARASEQLGRAADALAYLQRAVAADPQDATLHQMLGDALGRHGRISDAAVHYREAVRLRPGDVALHARLGFTLMLLSRPEEAVPQWEEALRLDPQLPGVRERLEKVRRDLSASRDLRQP